MRQIAATDKPKKMWKIPLSEASAGIANTYAHCCCAGIQNCSNESHLANLPILQSQQLSLFEKPLEFMDMR